MSKLKKLPAGEFQIMKVIWSNPSPISTLQIASQLENQQNRKQQTLLTLLTRLISKGFLSSERAGKERVYTPVVTEEEYLGFETRQFVDTFHNSSLKGLVKALYSSKMIDDDELSGLEESLKERE